MQGEAVSSYETYAQEDVTESDAAKPRSLRLCLSAFDRRRQPTWVPATAAASMRKLRLRGDGTLPQLPRRVGDIHLAAYFAAFFSFSSHSFSFSLHSFLFRYILFHGTARHAASAASAALVCAALARGAACCRAEALGAAGKIRASEKGGVAWRVAHVAGVAAAGSHLLDVPASKRVHSVGKSKTRFRKAPKSENVYIKLLVKV